MLQTIREQSWSRGKHVRAINFDSLSFCQQVEAFARAKVAILHHGAAVSGNGLFMPKDSILVELCAQHNMSRAGGYQLLHPVFADCGNMGWAMAIGRNYIGSRLAFAVGDQADPALRSYYHRALPVQVNHTRWLWTLNNAIAQVLSYTT